MTVAVVLLLIVAAWGLGWTLGRRNSAYDSQTMDLLAARARIRAIEKATIQAMCQTVDGLVDDGIDTRQQHTQEVDHARS
jgi:hypothetical protein